MNYSKQLDVLQHLRDAQYAQYDMREAVREAELFIEKRDGQWEPEIITRMRGKPRYTDDRVNPIVNQIAGELENAQFSLKVRPAGGEATKELAVIRDGLIRNIRNLSNADAIMSQAGRKMVSSGFAAWLITHDYYDSDSFDQDLMLEQIHDAVDRVWLDPDDLTNDGSDAKWGVVLQYISTDEFESQFPGKAPRSIGGGGVSVGNYQFNNAYYFKPDHVTIAHFYYLEEYQDQLYRLSDGRVLKASQTPEEILDDLEQQGITIEDTRDIKSKRCMMRMFDAADWLTDAEETVFDCVPIVPVYGNFNILEGKITYRGVVEKLMDMQRVHNYSFSRNVEEIALSPRKKIFMTQEQAEGHEEQLTSLNTNMDPVQFYNLQEGAPPPFEGGAPTPNQAVNTLTEQSDQAISKAAGLFAANLGANTQLQSGVAIEKQIDRGNNGTSIYFKSMETAITRTGKILLKAIPIVYDATRQVRLLREDGSIEQVILNNVIIDQQTQQEHYLNDLTVGKYDVVCDIGPAYKNRQQEAADMFLRAAERDPSLLQVGSDIWVNNITAPGFDKLAERLRALALQNGVIPFDQMTQEEQQQVQEQQANAQEEGPSLEQMQLEIAQMQAQTQLLSQQNRQVEHQIQLAKIQGDQQAAQQKLESNLAVNAAKINQTDRRIDLEGERVALEAQRDQFNRAMETFNMTLQRMETLTNSLESIKQATGVDVIVSPEAAEAYQQTAEKITDSKL